MKTYSVEIPDWVNRVPIGTVLAEYYTKKHKLPASLGKCKLKRFGSKYIYVDSKNKKVVRNKNKIGNTIHWNLNGQSFYSATIHWNTRSKITAFYAKYFKDYIIEQLPEKIPSYLGYALNIQMIIYDRYSTFTPDITNMWLLFKLFEDNLVKNKVIKDDSPGFILKTSYEYKFIEKHEERRLVFEFSYIKQHTTL